MSSAAHRTFDRLFAEGRRALVTGTHKVESAPVEGRPRWGIGVVLRPDPVAAHAIEQAAVEAAAVAGGEHSAGPRRAQLASDPPQGPGTLQVTGPARGSAHRQVRGRHVRRCRRRPLVAVCRDWPHLDPGVSDGVCRSAGAAPGKLAQDLTAALRAEGCGHAGRAPDAWYVNLVYFTGPVRDPRGLVEWVAARRAAKVTDLLVADIQLVRWRHIGDGMIPVVLASAMSQ